jgi:DnaK suppressor protein
MNQGDPMNTPLTAGQKALLYAELIQRRDALNAQLASHLHGQTRAERAHDVLNQDGDDAPQRLPEREIAQALTDHERRELDAVSAAMLRLDKGEYGRCADCSTDIPYDRLKAEPWAQRCVPCATRLESRQR